MARGITIGTDHYPSKEAVRETCRAIVRRYGLGGDVTEVADDTFLRALIELHPEYEVKRGAGIAHFRVIGSAWGAKSAGFAVVRHGGEVVDFSWNACLTPPTHRAQILGALRRLVADQVISARNGVLNSGTPLVCAVTGAPILSVSELHMDHAPPTFLALAERFIAGHGGLSAFQVARETGDRVGCAELADEALGAQWRDYHQAYAVLRPVLRRVNLSDLRRAAKP